MPRFIRGIQLNQLFYREAVTPALASEFPGLRYSAALLGHSGPTCLVLIRSVPPITSGGRVWCCSLTRTIAKCWVVQVDEVLSTRLLGEFRGYPTNFTEPDENRVRIMTRRHRSGTPSCLSAWPARVRQKPSGRGPGCRVLRRRLAADVSKRFAGAHGRGRLLRRCAPYYAAVRPTVNGSVRRLCA
jgi:hypothetical protein